MTTPETDIPEVPAIPDGEVVVIMPPLTPLPLPQPELVREEEYKPRSLVSQRVIWEVTGELVDFAHMVWFNKVTKTWDRFGPESLFKEYDDGHVEVVDE